MKARFIQILLLIVCNQAFSQRGAVSTDTFYFRQFHSIKQLVLRSDSTLYFHGRTFEFGKWQKSGDTIIVKKYRFFEADTISYNIEYNKIIIAVFNCSFLPLSNQPVKFHHPEITAKTNANGEIIIEKRNFSGLINEYDIRRFLYLGIRSVTIYKCGDEGLLKKDKDYNFGIDTFVIQKAGLLNLSTNKLWLKQSTKDKTTY